MASTRTTWAGAGIGAHTDCAGPRARDVTPMLQECATSNDLGEQRVELCECVSERRVSATDAARRWLHHVRDERRHQYSRR